MLHLAIDLGQRRTGLALGDPQTGVASPLSVIESRDEKRLLGLIAAEIAAHQPAAVIVGLPLNMDGTRGPVAARAEAFAARLRLLVSVPVHLFDERLSSTEAEEQLAGRGLTHRQKKARRDALAAAAILRNYWLGTSSNP